MVIRAGLGESQGGSRDSCTGCLSYSEANGNEAKRASGMAILGVFNRTPVCMTPSQPQNAPLGRKECLLLPYKPNPNPCPNPLGHSKTIPISKVSTISVRARQVEFALHFLPGLLTVATMGGQMKTWLNLTKNWVWLWESNSGIIIGRYTSLGPCTARHRRTMSGVEKAPKIPVARRTAGYISRYPGSGP